MLHFRPVSFGFDSSTGRLRRSRRDRKISQVMRTDVLWCDVIERCRAAATTSIRHITTLVGAGRIYTATDRSHSADCFNTHGAGVSAATAGRRRVTQRTMASIAQSTAQCIWSFYASANYARRMLYVYTVCCCLDVRIPEWHEPDSQIVGHIVSYSAYWRASPLHTCSSGGIIWPRAVFSSLVTYLSNYHRHGVLPWFTKFQNIDPY